VSVKAESIQNPSDSLDLCGVEPKRSHHNETHKSSVGAGRHPGFDLFSTPAKVQEPKSARAENQGGSSYTRKRPDQAQRDLLWEGRTQVGT